MDTHHDEIEQREIYEVSFFLSAFIQKHRIFAITPREDREDDDDKMSMEDHMRMKMMMDGMQNKSILPMIEREEDKQ